MLIYRRTSLMDSTAQTLVNTVNCVGVMGKGVAREFKAREPRMFAAYKKLCDTKQLEPGKLWLWRGEHNWTLNFPTKLHWRNPSKIEWIDAGLKKFTMGYERLGIREISFPRLGCGNGNLEWTDVKPLMESYLSELPIDIYIHDYNVDIGLPEHLEAVAATLVSEQTDDPTFIAFVESLKRGLALSDNSLRDLITKEHITAKLDDDELLVQGGGETWKYELEDLRGVWVALQRGLLTQEKVGWSAGGGHQLLSVLSILPQIRPIEIQRLRSEPELAVELRPQGSISVPDAQRQRELSWD